MNYLDSLAAELLRATDAPNLPLEPMRDGDLATTVVVVKIDPEGDRSTWLEAGAALRGQIIASGKTRCVEPFTPIAGVDWAVARTPRLAVRVVRQYRIEQDRPDMSAAIALV